MNNLKYLWQSKWKIFVSLFTLIFYASAFIFLMSLYYSEKNHLEKSNNLPDNYVYVIDNDNFSEKEYESILQDRFSNGIVSSYAIRKEYINGQIVTVVGIDKYALSTGIYLDNYLYLVNGNELNSKNIIVSTPLASFTDLSVNEENFMIVGSFVCDDYVIIMDINDFISYVQDIRITLEETTRIAYQYHLIKLPEKPSEEDVRGIWRLYDYHSELIAEENIYTKEIFVHKELAKKALNEGLIILLFILAIGCFAIPLIGFGKIYFKKRRESFLEQKRDGISNVRIRGVILLNSIFLGLVVSVMGMLFGLLIYVIFAKISGAVFILIPVNYYFLLNLVIIGLLVFIGQIMFLFEGRKLKRMLKQEI